MSSSYPFFEIIKNLEVMDYGLKINSATRVRLLEFANMILSFRIMMETQDALPLPNISLSVPVFSTNSKKMVPPKE